MTRWIAAWAGALAVAFTLGIAMPLGNEAAADGMKKAPVYSAPTKKRCIAPAGWWMRTTTGTTWVCAAAEICCYDRLLRRGSCLPASQRCF
jgi:hypothetical protein